MSGAEQQQGMDILLPAARVMIFSRDQETLESAKGLQADWRFARVDIRVVEGDTLTAAQVFQQEGRSPDLVIIQTEDIDESFTEKLGTLSGYCDEGTSAVIIGPVNDVYLYRRLIDMGVSDYLVRPIKPETLVQVIGKTLVSKLGLSGSSLISFIGAKGGVGVSSIAQSAAWLCASVLEQKVMLLDGAGGLSSLGVGMGFDPSGTLSDLLRAVDQNNEDNLKRMIFRPHENLSVIAGGSDAVLDPSVAADGFEKIINKLMVKSPVVMVDLSCTPTALRKMVIARSTRIVLVTTPSVTSLRFARGLLKEIADVRGGDKKSTSLLLNFVGMAKAHEVPASDVDAALGFKPSGVIPFLPQGFMAAETQSDRLIKERETSEFLKGALLPLLKSVLSGGDGKSDDKDKKSGFIGGFLTKITSK